MAQATSERITWAVCPECRRPAAVGWSDERPVEFDCVSGCQPRPEQVELLTVRDES